ncbi:hypothetical protein [Nitrosopumilus ureiphilus]|nr:hypothetical protein [Nitrosopumilus ureiphilus]
MIQSRHHALSVGKAIGEVDYDVEIIRPKCGQCSNPTSHIKDKLPFILYS